MSHPSPVPSVEGPSLYAEIMTQVALALPEDGLVSVAQLVESAQFLGLLTKEPSQLREQRLRLRLYLSRASTQFPTLGDGMLFIQGQAPFPGWRAERWRSVLLKEAHGGPCAGG